MEEIKMLEILRYIFSSFWIFLGTAILLGLIAKIVIYIFAIIFHGKD